MVQHRQLNLLQDFSHLGAFDVIFCRNVLIYFDQDTKAGIFRKLAKVLEPDGYLLLGAAENRRRADRRIQAMSGSAWALSFERSSDAARPRQGCRRHYAPWLRPRGEPIAGYAGKLRHNRKPLIESRQGGDVCR